MALNKRLISWVFSLLAAPCGHAQSEVYKCPDASGRPTYTNVKRDIVGKNCTLREQGSIGCASSSPYAGRAIFDRIGPGRRATRTAGGFWSRNSRTSSNYLRRPAEARRAGRNSLTATSAITLGCLTG